MKHYPWNSVYFELKPANQILIYIKKYETICLNVHQNIGAWLANSIVWVFFPWFSFYPDTCHSRECHSMSETEDSGVGSLGTVLFHSLFFILLFWLNTNQWVNLLVKCCLLGAITVITYICFFNSEPLFLVRLWSTTK